MGSILAVLIAIVAVGIYLFQHFAITKNKNNLNIAYDAFRAARNGNIHRGWCLALPEFTQRLTCERCERCVCQTLIICNNNMCANCDRITRKRNVKR